MVDIVLVHGTTQTAAGFDALVGELASRGHRAIAVSVPSAGAETAVGYADLLAAQVPDDMDRPVVLGHSAGGLLLPALSRRLRARHQIWLAAAVADYSGRRSFLAEVRGDPGRVAQPEWLGVDPATDPVMATYFLFHDADLGALRAALATVAVCDLTAVYAETPNLDPGAIPSTYLLPVDDRTLRPSWMEHIARERLRVEPVRIAGGHNCYAGQAAVTAQAVVDACRTHT